MSTHPLDPLTPEELARAVEIVRKERELGSRVRFIRVDLEEPAKPELAAGHRRTAAGARRHSRQRRQARIRGDRRPGGRRRRALDAAGRDPAGDLGRRVRRGRRGGAGRPGLPRGAGPPGDHRRRPRLGAHRAVVGRIVRDLRPAARPRPLLAALVRRRRQPVRPADRAAGCGRRPERDDGRPRRRPRRRADPAGERGLPRRCGRAVSRRPEAAGDRAAGRPQLRAGRPRAAMAEVADAGRLREPRGPRAPPDRVRGRRRAPLRVPPRVDRRAGHSRTAIPARPCTSRTSSTSASTAWDR